MKYVFLLMVLVGGGLSYIYFQQPELWNRLVTTVGLPNLTFASDTAASPDTTPAAGAAAPAAHSDEAEVISPDTTNYINSDHVREVEQPTQPAATNATSAAPIPAAPAPAVPNPAALTPAAKTP